MLDANVNNLELMSKEELVEILTKMINGGVALSFNGRRTAQMIQRKVMPRVVHINKELSYNDLGGKCNNLLVDGENLQAMVTLYKYRGTVDLIVTRRIIQEKTSVTMINGIQIQTIQSWVRL